MKSAIYLDEGTTQVVLTPENEWERSALKMIADSAGQQTLTFWAKFYECAGGWFRQGQAVRGAFGGYEQIADDSSLMFRINKRVPDVPPQAPDHEQA